MFSQLQLSALLGRAEINKHETRARQSIRSAVGQRMASDPTMMLVYRSDDDDDDDDKNNASTRSQLFAARDPLPPPDAA